MPSWEWFGDPPTEKEVLELLTKLPETWGVAPHAYVEYVLPMTKKQKIETAPGVTEHVPVTKLYMQVAGRVKMINDGAEKGGWQVTETQTLLQTDPAVLQLGIQISPPRGLGVTVEPSKGQPYGVRFGISKAKGGDTAWEKMETAARGRALGAWGFGILPGSGIASFEEMELVGVDLTPETKEAKQKARTQEELIDEIFEVKTELAQIRGQLMEELDQGLVAYVKRRWRKDVEISEESGIDLSPLKDGQLVIMHNDLVQQLKLARADEERKL